MKQLRSTTILMAALLGACASVDEPTTSTTPMPYSNATEATATPGPMARSQGPAAPMTPDRSSAWSTKMGAPDRNSIYFDYDKDDIRPEFRSVMEEHAKYLRANPMMRARIEGNADERGSREYNLALGQRRAEAVMSNLRLLGVPESRMEAVSNGEEKPRRAGHEETSWAENRRGDLVIR
jgi:peptidoglycan-associated lipoprotein